MPRLTWVDRLKGFAFVWIFVNHAVEQTIGFPAFGNPEPGWPPLVERVRQLTPLAGRGVWDVPLNLFRYAGWLGDHGVGLFLLLAGFVLAWGMPERRERGWKEFYARRFFRIYPLWWGAHAIVLVAGVLGLLSQPLSIPRFLLSVAGVRVDPETFYAFSAPWWYVGLLLQLYLVFPLLWTLLQRWGPGRLLMAAVLLAVAVRGAAMAWLTAGMDPVMRGSFFPSRLPEFVLGMALATWMHRDEEAAVRLLRSARAILGGLLVYVAGTALSFTWAGMTVAPLLTSAGAFGLLFAAAAATESGPRRGMLEWVGIHSYAFFLMHQIVLKRVGPSDLSGPSAVVRLAAAVGVTVAGGLLLERGVALVEKGLRRWKERAGVRGLMAQSGAIVAILGILLVGAELWSRRTAPMELQGWGERASLVPDPELGWRLKPSTTTRLRWESYDYRVTSNALGYPGSDVAEARPAGTLRILVTGDAFSSAEGVDTVDAWPRLLEARLAELHPGKRFQVLNFAMTGYGPEQYARVLDRFVPSFKPDLVIVESYVNDFLDVLIPTEKFQEDIGFEKPDPDGLRSVLTLTNLRVWLKLHALGPRISRWRGRPDTNGFLFGGFYYVERRPHEIWSEGSAKLADRFSTMRSVCRDFGSRLLVVSAPAAVQVCDRTQLPYFPACLDLSEATEYDLDRPQRTLQKIVEDLKLGFIDLRRPLKECRELPYQPANMHWTKAGHRAVADHLANVLSEDPELMRRAGEEIYSTR